MTWPETSVPPVRPILSTDPIPPAAVPYGDERSLPVPVATVPLPEAVA